ncbi:MAG TPA: hypothetical protein VHZ07_25440 [Bryobacteraceae bacterium]|nr:hypothetical protein [Bryobacteraceae bacterium]
MNAVQKSCLQREIADNGTNRLCLFQDALTGDWAARLSARRIFEAAAVLLFLITVLLQAFWPRPFGLANNRDFPKVLGRIGAWPPPELTGEEFTYFISDYALDSRHTWDAHLPTTELYFAEAAKWLGSFVSKPGHFDIRFLGILHLSVLTLAFWLIVRTFRDLPWRRSIGLVFISVLILADVEYLEFLNTPLMDAAAIPLLVLMAAIMVNFSFARREPRWPAILAFGVSSAAFLGTKLQHQLCLLPLLIFCAWFGTASVQRKGRLAWLISSLLMVVTSTFMLTSYPAGYLTEPRFDVTFLKLTMLSSNPTGVLAELGRPSSDLAYRGMHAYALGSPLKSAQYRWQFSRDVTTEKLLAFYVRHPAVTFDILWDDLRKSGADIPVSEVPVGLSEKTYVIIGVYRKSDDPVGHRRPRGLSLWSDLRRQIARRVPILMPLIVVTALVWGSTRLWTRSRRAQTAILLFTLSSIALLSFLTGSLGDGVDTSRHIVAYQVSIDLLILFSLRMALSKSEIWSASRASSHVEAYAAV